MLKGDFTNLITGDGKTDFSAGRRAPGTTTT